MADLYAWAGPIGSKVIGIRSEHVWLTSYKDSFIGNVPPGPSWGCFGRVRSPHKGRLIAQVNDADLNAVQKLGAEAGILWGITGVCHQAANRLLAVGSRGKSPPTVSKANGYWGSAFAWGTYGRNIQSGNLFRVSDFLANKDIPDEIKKYYAPEEPLPDTLVELSCVLPKLIAEVESDPVKLYELKPVVFEQLVAELLSAYGWRVHLTSATKDGGFDIFAISKDVSGLETSWLVECKRWAENRPVGVEIVRSLYSVKSDLHVANALLATTSRFTSGVEEFGRRNYDLALSDFHDICRWIREYRPQKGRKIHLQKESLILPVDLRKKT